MADYLPKIGSHSCSGSGKKTSGNLLINGDFEDGFSGWEIVGSPTIVPDRVGLMPFSGSNFCMGGDVAFCEIKQRVNVSGVAGRLIRIGCARSSYTGQDDESKIVLSVFNSAGSLIKSMNVFNGAVNDLEWIKHWAELALPIGADSVELSISMLRRAGRYNDAYIDDVSLEIITDE